MPWAFPTSIRLFDEKYYAQLDGGILESFGRLFKSDIRLYVYPCMDAATGKLITAETVGMPANLQQLYAYLRANQKIVPIRDVNEKNLHIFPKQVLRLIQSGDSSWEDMVPQEGVRLIKQRGVFGYHSRTG